MAETLYAGDARTVGRTIYRSPQPVGSELRAVVTERDGEPFASLRLFYPDRLRTTWYPSDRNGLTVPVSRLPELREAVAALEHAASASTPSSGRS